jgi:hypothetical protein
MQIEQREFEGGLIRVSLTPDRLALTEADIARASRVGRGVLQLERQALGPDRHTGSVTRRALSKAGS